MNNEWIIENLIESKLSKSNLIAKLCSTLAIAISRIFHCEKRFYTIMNKFILENSVNLSCSMSDFKSKKKYIKNYTN